MSQLRAFDIGGSGVKTVQLDLNSDIKTIPQRKIEYHRNPDWTNFVIWAADKGLLDCNLIGISCAGFIENNQNIRLFRVGNWINKPLAREIQSRKPSVKIHILNDAEAHLMAHYGMYAPPCMNIALGTSLGFAISDQSGRIFRPPDNINFDIGELSISTRASISKVWWALGSAWVGRIGENFGTRERGDSFWI